MKYIKAIFLLTLTGAIIWSVLAIRSCKQRIEKPASLEVGYDNEINKTTAVLRSVERLGQWEFLSIDDEVMVDTIDSHLLMPDDRLARIYHGTIRLGIDFSQCDRGWAEVQGDTATLRLPAIGLLDRNFIDEARTRSFYEQGSWDAQAREEMYQRARNIMIRRAMTPENIKEAEKNARHQVEALFRSLGYSVIKVTIEPSSSRP